MNSMNLKNLSAMALTGVSSALAGCGSMPHVAVGYYLPTASAEIRVTQTAVCTTGDIGVLTTAVDVAPTYSRDTAKQKTFNLRRMGHGMTKADAAFAFYSDGRLKSVNAIGTGKAVEGLKALISLLEVSGVAAVRTDEEKAACQVVRSAAGEGKALTIVSIGNTTFDDSPIVFKQTSVSTTVYNQVGPIFGSIAATVSTTPVTGAPHVVAVADKSQRLSMLEPASGTVDVVVSRGNQQLQFSGPVWVPQAGREYELPIQKGPWFGENAFELEVAESGRVTKIRYAGGNAAAGAFGALSEALGAAEDASLVDQVNAAKNLADLIYQQQRLVLCQADHVNCPK
jgi:hypothetical protein